MGTAAQPIPYLGRAFSISITPQNGGQQVTIASTPATPSLEVTFTVNTYLLMRFWEAQVVIYNLDKQLAQNIASNSPTSQAAQTNTLPATQDLQMGDLVTISAGYQQTAAGAFSPTASLLYSGNVLQSILTRQNVVDSKLILRCVTDLAVSSFASVNLSISSGKTDEFLINQVCDSCTPKINIDNIDSASQLALQQLRYPRGHAIRDRPIAIIEQIAKQHNIFPWLGPNGLRMILPDANTPPVPKYIYGPPNLSSYTTGQTAPTTTVKTTLLGVPEQTQDGVLFRVLMDSQVQIGDVVQIATGTAINGFQFPFPGLGPLPNAAGIYFVAGTRHVGDVRGRGDDWYTEILGMTQKWFSTYIKTRSATSSQ